MKAAVIEEQGPVENIRYRDWPDPVIGSDEVLVRVKACALNYLDLEVRRGMPGHPIETPWISGGDAAGVVEAVGPEVTRAKPGDRVVLNPFGRDGMMGEECQGGLAELAKVPQEQIIHIPANVSFEQAAALPVGYGTAHRMMFDRARVQPGELVLILGAAGGVGLGCLQIAKEIGARTICVSSRAESLEQLTALGSDHVINTSKEDFSRAAWKLSEKKGIDVCVNYIGGETWVPALRAMKPGGRVVTCGASAGFDPQTDIRYIWTRELDILGANGWTEDGIAWLLERIAAGALEPVIDSVFPLSEIQEAQRKLEERRIFGKVVLQP
ncbi:MAG: zinc-binding dehydrogenase [Alphaproteobacteria bacterium]|nr:zinc-binding dehydrogenase [Alphaproteobacteria bacterium]